MEHAFVVCVLQSIKELGQVKTGELNGKTTQLKRGEEREEKREKGRREEGRRGRRKRRGRGKIEEGRQAENHFLSEKRKWKVRPGCKEEERRREQGREDGRGLEEEDEEGAERKGRDGG